MIILLATALTLGFVHGLGADHLMAIAALSVARDRAASTRTFGLAVRFAAGHALLLAAGASAVIVLGWNIPVLLERAGEVAGGLMLVGLGAAGLWVALTDRIYAHAHAERRPHVHFGLRGEHPRPFGHSQVPGLVGAVFAVSGLRSLTLMLPFGSHSLAAILSIVLMFAAGILLSMSLFGIFLARALGSAATARLGRAASAVTGAASFALGLYWIVG